MDLDHFMVLQFSCDFDLRWTKLDSIHFWGGSYLLHVSSFWDQAENAELLEHFYLWLRVKIQKGF